MFQQASKRAFVSNAYCERKKNHSYPHSQGSWALEFFNHQSGKISLSLRASTSGHSLQGHWRASSTHSVVWANSARIFGFGSPRTSAWARVASKGGSGSSPQVRGPRGQSREPRWVFLAEQEKEGKAGSVGTSTGGCSVPHSRRGPRHAVAGAQSPAGDTELWQLHPPHPLPACQLTCQLLKPRGTPHREPGFQRFNPLLLRAAPSLGSMGGHALGQVREER